MTDSKYKINVPIENGVEVDANFKQTAEVSVRAIAKSFTPEQFAEMLGDYMNCLCNEYKRGQDIGHELQYQHRTLQGSVCRLLLGMLVGIGDTEYFDPRNEKAVAVGKKLKAMIDSGELDFGYMI